MISEIHLEIQEVDPSEILGPQNSYLNFLKSEYLDLEISTRGNKLMLKGEKKFTQKLKAQIELLIKILKEKKELTLSDVQGVINGANMMEHKLVQSSENIVVYGRNGKVVKARTRNQKRMIDASEQNDILFAVGPAGTGKTYLAVALAVKALKNRLVSKIILSRPAVEAGENLGFLPGELKDKIDPYLRPLYDALEDLIDREQLERLRNENRIEIVPLAYMRGRTLNDAFIILDEAQNATNLQMKMFLTRLGPSAKCIITGDLTQIDLNRSMQSGLMKSLQILQNIEGIAQIQLSAEDVVRHRLVKEIILAYEKDKEEFLQIKKIDHESAKNNLESTI